jgi:hypothetical protein
MLILKIKNITRTFDVADYHFELAVNDQTIAIGKVRNHRRRTGYASLIDDIANVLRQTGDPKPEDAPEEENE